MIRFTLALAILGVTFGMLVASYLYTIAISSRAKVPLYTCKTG